MGFQLSQHVLVLAAHQPRSTEACPLILNDSNNIVQHHSVVSATNPPSAPATDVSCCQNAVNQIMHDTAPTDSPQ